MADIFNKNITTRPGPLARAETVQVFINGGGDPVGLAQSVQITYGQQLQRVYELGTFDTYMVSGRTQGSLQIARFIGTTQSGLTLRQILGDDFFVVDGGSGGTLLLKDPVTGVAYECKGCYVASQSVGVDAQGTVITENVSVEFQSLTVKPS
jgi:hypothetical protein